MKTKIPDYLKDDPSIVFYAENEPPTVKCSEVYGVDFKKDIRVIKSLAEIQQENRIIISELTLKGEDLRLFRIYGVKGNPLNLNLSRVLLVFSNKFFKNTVALNFPDFLWVNGINWNLTKESLEEQTEEVQRSLWELLTKEENDK